MKLKIKKLIKADVSFNVYDENNYDGDGVYLLQFEDLQQFSLTTINEGVVYNVIFLSEQYDVFKESIENQVDDERDINNDSHSVESSIIDKEFILEFARILKG